MQALEAHVFHHGYAYRQGGEEYLILLPSLSKPLSIAFLQELRVKLAELSYPEIAEKTAVSIGLSWIRIVLLPTGNCWSAPIEPRGSPKRKEKNRIATYRGPRLAEEELEIVQG